MLTEGSPDVSITKIPGTDACVISSTDFFSPITQDPYKQGAIACANTLSDLYAVGVDRIDTMLMILGVSLKMGEEERKIATVKMIEGFNDTCALAGCRVTGGQTVFNPWPLLGGCATAVVQEADIVKSDMAEAGDVLVLTKPLGTQVAGNLSLWMLDEAKWEIASKHIDETTAARAVSLAESSMMRLNRNAARLMCEFNANGCTDVTGFGIMGHAQNLAHVQAQPVSFVIDTLPIIRGLKDVEKTVTVDYRLTHGYSAETSGGLLVILPESNVEGFISGLRAADGSDAWVIGKVVEGDRHVRLSDDVAVLEV